MAPSQPNIKQAEKKAKAEKKNRDLPFMKRKKGLFNKVTELSILSRAETALIVESGEELFACGYPSPDAVIQRYLTGKSPCLAVKRQQEEEEEKKVEALRTEYEAVQERLKEEQRNLQVITEEQEKIKKISGFPCWWETPIDDVDFEFVEQFKISMEALRQNLVAHHRCCDLLQLPPQPQPQMIELPPQSMANFLPVLPEYSYSQPLPMVPSLPPLPMTEYCGWQPQPAVRNATTGIWIPSGHRIPKSRSVVESEFGSSSKTFMTPPM